jgi:hypothetical protein
VVGLGCAPNAGTGEAPLSDPGPGEPVWSEAATGIVDRTLTANGSPDGGCNATDSTESFDRATQQYRIVRCENGTRVSRERILSSNEAQTILDAAAQLRAVPERSCDGFDGVVGYITIQAGGQDSSFQVGSPNCSIGFRTRVITSQSARALVVAFNTVRNATP